jgi:hypothetical protein
MVAIHAVDQFDEAPLDAAAVVPVKPMVRNTKPSLVISKQGSCRLRGSLQALAPKLGAAGDGSDNAARMLLNTWSWRFWKKSATSRLVANTRPSREWTMGALTVARARLSTWMGSPDQFASFVLPRCRQLKLSTSKLH